MDDFRLSVGLLVVSLLVESLSGWVLLSVLRSLGPEERPLLLLLVNVAIFHRRITAVSELHLEYYHQGIVWW